MEKFRSNEKSFRAWSGSNVYFNNDDDDDDGTKNNTNNNRFLLYFFSCSGYLKVDNVKMTYFLPLLPPPHLTRTTITGGTAASAAAAAAQAPGASGEVYAAQFGASAGSATKILHGANFAKLT